MKAEVNYAHTYVDIWKLFFGMCINPIKDKRCCRYVKYLFFAKAKKIEMVQNSIPTKKWCQGCKKA